MDPMIPPVNPAVFSIARHSHLLTVLQAAFLVVSLWPEGLQKAWNAPLRRLFFGEPDNPGHPPQLRDLCFPGLGHWRLNSITPPHLERLQHQIHAFVGMQVVLVRGARKRPLRSYDPAAWGHGATNNFVDVAKTFFADAQGLKLCRLNPAEGLRKIHHRFVPRRPLLPEEWRRLHLIAQFTGDDPPLDTRLVNFLTLTGCRASAIENLAICHIDVANAKIDITDKHGKTRELPVAQSVLSDWLKFAASRGATGPGDAVFRFKNGTPVTGRRLDNVFGRLHDKYPSTAVTGISPHWLRHSVLALVAEVSDMDMAAAWGGHARPRRVTAIYVPEPTFRAKCEVAEIIYGPLFDLAERPA